jgi:hypothetical protein
MWSITPQVMVMPVVSMAIADGLRINFKCLPAPIIVAIMSKINSVCPKS